jgi:hypothetical protein
MLACHQPQALQLAERQCVPLAGAYECKLSGQ